MTSDNTITTCCVKNKHDNQSLTLCTEWLESGLKISIFTTDSVPLTGELKTSEIDTFAENLSKTRSEYLDLTRSVLSGKDASVECLLKDSKLKWKKGPWNYGMINLAPEPLEQVYSKLLDKLLLRHAQLEETVEKLETENGELKGSEARLNEKLEDMISAKNKIEEDLYRRFIVVLNSKKEKIRELSKRNGERGTNDGDKERIYEAETEDSEGSDKEEKSEEKVKPQTVVNRTFISGDIFGDEKLLTRQISDSDGKMSDSECEGGRKMLKNCKYSGQLGKGNSKRKAEPSTSTNNNDNGEKLVDDMRKKRSMFNIDSEESEEDMFA